MCSGLLLLLAQVFKLNTDVLSHYLFIFLKTGAEYGRYIGACQDWHFQKQLQKKIYEQI